MSIVYACIAPHGYEIIPKLAGKLFEAFEETREGMKLMASTLKRGRPSTVVIATPHGLRLEHTIAVVTAEYCEGTLKAHGKSVNIRCKCDRKLASSILQLARGAKLPVVGANFGSNEGPSSCMPMDWGTFIPLWFFGGKPKTAPERKIVIVAPSREIPLTELVRFGEVISDAAESSDKKVAFVASADQGHAHDKNGPYGYHPASLEYDKLVVKAVKENNLKLLLELDAEFIENAKPDSLWQIAILSGVLTRVPLKARFVSYQAPTYYGMLCADFQS
ncbi:MAG: extradiol ring-cleavage dioxygenase [Candidatus Bathyarchaeota archaeon]|nr:MAG: extradiol ring-cleavage dioxygenase [Candidatus Bathyarchaeota archaeon]